jgi:hypothetical protein
MLAVPSIALAVNSYEGSDYSFDSGPIGTNIVMYTCDMESDSRHVYAEYQIASGEWSEVVDGNGANNSCGTRGYYAGIEQHRTCEAIDFWPDACGSYVYP